MVHRRSRESYERRMKEWEDWKAEQDLPYRTVLDYAYHDILNCDKVFTLETQSIIIEKLKELYPDGGLPTHLVKDERFGEILNRFPLRVQKTLNMIPYRMWPVVGSFQQ